MITLKEFVAESNRIEGIDDVSRKDMEAHENLLARPILTVQDIERFVSLVQPNAILRRLIGLNVRVGNYIAPAGGPKIEPALATILEHANTARRSVEDGVASGIKYAATGVHLQYEDLHPFSDGNGRSGRAIWLWMRAGNTGKGGFLSQWVIDCVEYDLSGFYEKRDMYYQSLSYRRG